MIDTSDEAVEQSVIDLNTLLFDYADAETGKPNCSEGEAIVQAVALIKQLQAQRIRSDAAFASLFPEDQLGIGPKSVIEGWPVNEALERHAKRGEKPFKPDLVELGKWLSEKFGPRHGPIGMEVATDDDGRPWVRIWTVPGVLWIDYLPSVAGVMADRLSDLATRVTVQGLRWSADRARSP